MQHEPVIIERIYNVSIHTVWEALTDVKALRQWFFDVPAFEARLGFEFEFRGKGADGEDYLHKCVVTEVNEPYKLSYSWRYEGYEHISLVTYELQANSNKTHIRLTHSGLESFPASGAFAKENFVQGWTALIGSLLKSYAEKMDPIA